MAHPFHPGVPQRGRAGPGKRGKLIRQEDVSQEVNRPELPNHTQHGLRRQAFSKI
jgi:hypothetical protein